jgi:GTP:adenosylcobinamide-phosphate guanylyltransferase
MIDLFIIAAGTGSRLNSEVPKALTDIRGRACIDYLVDHALPHFNEIFVVTNKQCQDAWKPWLSGSGITNVSIASGHGDGHATLSGLRGSGSIAPEVVVCWGDIFLESDKIFSEIVNYPLLGAGCIPARYENNPYVTLTTELTLYPSSCTGALFSKYGETRDQGYHDQSMFRFNKAPLIASLTSLDAAYWKTNKYMTPGNELSLLHTFHYLYNIGQPLQIYDTKETVMSFNTQEELEKIISSIPYSI